MESFVRDVLRDRGDLTRAVDTLAAHDDLFDAGLTSFGTVEVMLAMEEQLGVSFPEHLLRRATFGSIAALGAAAEELRRLSVGV